MGPGAQHIFDEWMESGEAKSGRRGISKANSILKFTAATDKDLTNVFRPIFWGLVSLCNLELCTADK